MLDLKIDCLNLNIEDAAGHEHRIQPIAMRAVNILADRLSDRWMAGDRSAGMMNIESLSVPSVSLNLNEMSDEQVADTIAGAWLEVLTLKLGV